MSGISAAPVRTLHARKGFDLSIKILTAVWALTVRNSTDKLVFLALADHANDSGRCWPSIAALQAKTQLSERSIRRSISNLKTDGHLRVGYSRGHSNRFELLTTQPVDNSPVTPATVAPTPATVAPPPRPHSQGRGATVAPRTVIEPSSESSMNLRARAPVDNSRTSKVSETRNRYSDTAEVRALSARAEALGYRPIGRIEDIEHYRMSINLFEREQSRSAMSNLRTGLDARRKAE